MAQANSTILIPDISGYTEFMTSTELYHGSHAINALIDAMLEAIDEDYEVSEIEGDAVLLIRKGAPSSKKDVLQTCLKIFNAFHFRRKWMQQHVLCACGACQAIINLSVKFVVHYGPLAEIKIGRFVKQSGVDMIVAHRLLKNSIQSNEYVLLTEKLLSEVNDSLDPIEMDWATASEEYQSLGKVDYQFSLLSDMRKRVPDPEPPETDYRIEDTSYSETFISASHLDVYSKLMDIPERPSWVDSLLSVEQDTDHVLIGSIHRCTFEDYLAIISPVRMTISDEGILYAESFEVKELDLSVVFEYLFRKETEKSCTLGCRFHNRLSSPIPEESRRWLNDKLQQVARRLKEHCEKTEMDVLV